MSRSKSLQALLPGTLPLEMVLNCDVELLCLG